MTEALDHYLDQRDEDYESMTQEMPLSIQMEDDATPAFGYADQVTELENRITELEARTADECLQQENYKLREDYEILSKGYEEACRQIAQMRKLK